MLSALSYFSILFSPLLLPIIIYLVTNDTEVRSHAKRSFISHIIPIALLIVGFILFSLSIFSLENRMFDMMQGNSSFWNISPLFFMLIYGLITAIIFIWNIVQGIRLIK
ncbi:DUF4870 domain-containing protein [Sporosarcina siberiensis]|uniref:DUF4870 domain-containing protein n=1 Tax=Sporosarcina siberiensis TaxID=1365606 RepID=A0ABW4SER5_9BACL